MYFHLVNIVKAADGEITEVSIKTGKESLDNNTYSGILKAVGDDGYIRQAVLKVTTECSGLVSFNYKGNNVDSVYLMLYSDEAMNNEKDNTSVEASSDEVMSSGLAVPKAGIYYLLMRAAELQDVDFTISADIGWV